MSKWKCDICNNEFNNFHAEGFEGKIYCPLCYYKHEYRDLQQQLSQLQQENKAQKEKLDSIKYLCETTGLDNYYFEPFIKTEIILQIIKGE